MSLSANGMGSEVALRAKCVASRELATLRLV